MELIEGCDLVDVIKSKKKFSWRDAATCIKTLLSAINYCHSHNIMHWDLKPDNLVIRKKSDGGFESYNEIKVIDFGFA